MEPKKTVESLSQDVGRLEGKMDALCSDVKTIKEALTGSNGIIKKMSSGSTQIKIQWALIAGIGVILAKLLGAW